MAEYTQYRDKPAELKWFQNLGVGMDQATDSVLTEGSPMLRNITLDQIGNWATRPGHELLGSAIATSAPGYGLGVYDATDGTHTMAAISGRDLYFYDESTGWGSAVDTDEWPASTKVDFANHINRLYIGSADGATPLAYSTGSTITDVTPTIGGNKFAVNKNILAVGGNSLKPNVIFFSNPFTDTFYEATGTVDADADTNGANTVITTEAVFESTMEGGILYNTTDGEMALITEYHAGLIPYVTTDTDTSGWDNDTVYVLQNNFKIDGPCTAQVEFQENFITFDQNNMYMWDPTTQPNGWSRKIKNYGCVNNRTVQVIDGMMIFANEDGIWLFDGETLPKDVSKKLKDPVNGYGIWNLITTTNWANACSGADFVNKKYHLSIGTLQTLSGAPGSALTNVEIILDVTTGDITIATSTQPGPIYAYTNFVNEDGAKNLYGIEGVDSVVKKLWTGTTDYDTSGDAVAISYLAQTPHRQLLEDPTITCIVEGYYVKYTSTASVTVKNSVDRGSYATLATLDSTSTVKTILIAPTANQEGFTHSLQFSGSGKTIIEGYGFLVRAGTTIMWPNK